MTERNDAVRLKTGGPEMLVCGTSSTGCECKWFEGKKLRRDFFPWDQVEHVGKAGAAPVVSGMKPDELTLLLTVGRVLHAVLGYGSQPYRDEDRAAIRKALAPFQGDASEPINEAAKTDA